MASIFTKIINKEIPAYVVAEDENNIAFLDINPVQIGHVLCVPKLEVDKLFDLDLPDYMSLQEFTFKVARGLEVSVPCKRIGEMVLGLEVPHAHIHLIPINSEADLSFANPRVSLSLEEFEALREKIQSNIDL